MLGRQVQNCSWDGGQAQAAVKILEGGKDRKERKRRKKRKICIP